MKTHEAYQESLIYAQQQADFYNALLWVLFTVFVIAPLIMAVVYLAVTYYLHRKGRL